MEVALPDNWIYRVNSRAFVERSLYEPSFKLYREISVLACAFFLREALPDLNLTLAGTRTLTFKRWERDEPRPAPFLSTAEVFRSVGMKPFFARLSSAMRFSSAARFFGIRYRRAYPTAQ